MELSEGVISTNLVMFNLHHLLQNYLRGVPVDSLDKLSALTTINKPLTLNIDSSYVHFSAKFLGKSRAGDRGK